MKDVSVGAGLMMFLGIVACLGWLVGATMSSPYFHDLGTRLEDMQSAVAQAAAAIVGGIVACTGALLVAIRRATRLLGGVDKEEAEVPPKPCPQCGAPMPATGRLCNHCAVLSVIRGREKRLVGAEQKAEKRT